MMRPRQEMLSNTIRRLLTSIKKKLAIKSPKKSKSKSNSKEHSKEHSKEPVKNTPENDNVENDVGSDPIACSVTVKYSDESTVNVNVLKNEEIISGMFFAYESITFQFVRTFYCKFLFN